MHFKYLTICSVIVSLIAGCGRLISTSENDILNSIPNRTTEIKIGKMGRSEVHGIFGEPYLSSVTWGFDLFRTETTREGYDFALPLIMPLHEKLSRYTLVAYDFNGYVSATATGIFREPSWSGGGIDGSYSSLHLDAGNLTLLLSVYYAKDFIIVAAPALRDSFFGHPPSSQECVVAIGCDDRKTGSEACPNQLSIDSAKAKSLKVRPTPHIETLVAIDLPIGDHTLEFSSKNHDGKYSSQVSCKPGQILYLMVNSFFKKGKHTDWHVEQTNQFPDLFAKNYLLLIENRTWVINSELK